MPEFKVFTLNVKGDYFSHKSQRLSAIAAYVEENTCDLICLQHVWSLKDYHKLQKRLEKVYPYSHYYLSGYRGSGICIFTKHLILQTYYHFWLLDGCSYNMVTKSDWYYGKGIAMAEIKWNNMSVMIYSAHLKNQVNTVSDEYIAGRVAQAFDIGQFILITSKGSDLVIFAGDLNTEPNDLAIRILVDMSQLQDSYLSKEGYPEPTFNTLDNTFTNPTMKQKLKKHNKNGVRFDYVLYKTGKKAQITVAKYEQPLPSRVPGHRFSYSHHEALLVTLKVSASGGNSADQIDIQIHQLYKALLLLKKAKLNVRLTKAFYSFWSIMCLVWMLALLLCDIFYNLVGGSFVVLFTIVFIYVLYMATTWTRLEDNAIYSAKLAIQVFLQHPRESSTWGKSKKSSKSSRPSSKLEDDSRASGKENPPPVLKALEDKQQSSREKTHGVIKNK